MATFLSREVKRNDFLANEVIARRETAWNLDVHWNTPLWKRRQENVEKHGKRLRTDVGLEPFAIRLLDEIRNLEPSRTRWVELVARC